MATFDELEYVLGPDSNSADRLRSVIDGAWNRLDEE